MGARDAVDPFQIIIENSPVAYALNDDKHNITYLNPEFVRTFGYTREDVPTLEAWWPSAYPDPAYRRTVIEEWGRRLNASRESGTPFEPMEVTIRAKDGTDRIVVAYAAGLEAAFAGAHLVVLFDITKRREAEAEQRRLQEALAHAQRIESLGRLAGGVAHDNNNMLAVIIGGVEVALLHATNGIVRDQLLQIREAAGRSAALMRQLLAYARKQAVAPAIVSLGDEVDGALGLLRALIGKDVVLESHVAGGVWPVRVDTTQLRQVITNLVLNARDAIDDAGTIHIGVANVPLAELADLPADAERTDYVRLTVTDNGRGMTPEIAARVFEPFFTTKQDGQGTGLGLSTVYGTAHQNGGFVTVRSSPGAGAMFAFYLPAHRTTKRASTPPPIEPHAETATILVVDDEPMILSLISRFLDSLGYEVLTATGPAEAERIASTRDDILLLISDVVMPGGSGPALAQRLTTRQPKLKVLLMSGYAANVEPGQGRPLLAKPFSMDELQARVAALLGPR